MIHQVRTISFVVVALLATFVWAHQSRTHVMGTVKALEGNVVTVETTEGKTVTITLDKEVRYLDLNGERTTARPEVGARMVADVAGPAGKWVASEVRLSATGGRVMKHHPAGASEHHHGGQHEHEHGMHSQ